MPTEIPLIHVPRPIPGVPPGPCPMWCDTSRLEVRATTPFVREATCPTCLKVIFMTSKDVTQRIDALDRITSLGWGHSILSKGGREAARAESEAPACLNKGGETWCGNRPTKTAPLGDVGCRDCLHQHLACLEQFMASPDIERRIKRCSDRLNELTMALPVHLLASAKLTWCEQYNARIEAEEIEDATCIACLETALIGEQDPGGKARRVRARIAALDAVTDSKTLDAEIQKSALHALASNDKVPFGGPPIVPLTYGSRPAGMTPAEFRDHARWHMDSAESYFTPGPARPATGHAFTPVTFGELLPGGRPVTQREIAERIDASMAPPQYDAVQRPIRAHVSLGPPHGADDPCVIRDVWTVPPPGPVAADRTGIDANLPPPRCSFVTPDGLSLIATARARGGMTEGDVRMLRDKHGCTALATHEVVQLGGDTKIDDPAVPACADHVGRLLGDEDAWVTPIGFEPAEPRLLGDEPNARRFNPATATGEDLDTLLGLANADRRAPGETDASVRARVEAALLASFGIAGSDGQVLFRRDGWGESILQRRRSLSQFQRGYVTDSDGGTREETDAEFRDRIKAEMAGKR